MGEYTIRLYLSQRISQGSSAIAAAAGAGSPDRAMAVRAVADPRRSPQRSRRDGLLRGDCVSHFAEARERAGVEVIGNGHSTAAEDAVEGALPASLMTCRRAAISSSRVFARHGARCVGRDGPSLCLAGPRTTHGHGASA